MPSSAEVLEDMEATLRHGVTACEQRIAAYLHYRNEHGARVVASQLDIYTGLLTKLHFTRRTETMRNHVKITVGENPHDVKISINGEPVAGVVAFSFSHKGMNVGIPTLHLELEAIEGVEIDAGDAEVDRWSDVERQEATELLDLVGAEFASDPTSVQCFDERVVARVRRFAHDHPTRR